MGRKDKIIPVQDDTRSTPGMRMRLARQQKGVSLTEMAKKLQYTKSYLSTVETSSGKPPQELVIKYERELRLEPGTLLHAIEEMSTAALSEQDRDQTASQTEEQHVAQVDLGEAPNIDHFYGRHHELDSLQRIIIKNRSRVVTILGIGGIGKSVLAAKLVTRLTRDFDFIVWHSLQNTPPLTQVIRQSLQFLAHPRQIDIPENEAEQIELLKEYMQKQRCLLILDNFESVLQGGSRVGQYKTGFEEYGKLIKIMGETHHQSCLLLTSREKPKETTLLEGMTLQVWQLAGIGPQEGREILKGQGIFGEQPDWEQLVARYGGNPLALKLVSAPIRELFDGKISEFLQVNELVLTDLRDLLDRQFERLSDQEHELLNWLAIEREAISFNALQTDILAIRTNADILEALNSLRRRSLVESSGSAHFTLQPVIMEYVTDNLVERMFQEIVSAVSQALEACSPQLLSGYALIKATAKDYVRNSQKRVILSPLASRLLLQLGKDGCERQLKSILAQVQKTRTHTPEYLAGNILNLLIELNADLRNYNFSSFVIRQAYLQGANLADVNFSDTEFIDSLFTDRFGSTLSVAMSPDGKLIAAGTTDTEIRIWQIPDGTPYMTLRGHTDWIRSEAFSPNNRILASASDDQTVRLWDLTTGQCINALHGHRGRVYAATFSNDGQFLASGGEDGTVRIWDAQTGQHIKILQGHSGRVYTVDFCSDNNRLVSGSEDRTLRIWDTRTGQCLNILQEHTDRVTSVSVSCKGNIIASGSEDQTVRLWDLQTGQPLKLLAGHEDWVDAVTINAEGTLMASGSEDQTVRLWDIKSGECLRILSGHKNWVKSVAFSPDSSVLISGSTDQTVRLWDVRTGQCLKVLQGVATVRYSVAFSPTGHSIVSGSEDQTVGLWDVETGRNYKTLRGHSNWIRSVAFSPQGNIVASGSEDGTVRLWDLQSGECINILRGHAIWVYAVAFSQDGSFVASGSEDEKIRLWDIGTGQCLKTLTGHKKGVWSVAFSPDGITLASASEDQMIFLWNVKTEQRLKELSGHNGWVTSVAYNHDGTILVSGSDDQTIRVWDIASGQCMNVLQGHINTVYSVACSPDGTLIASGGEDKTVRIWEIATGRLLATLTEHDMWIYSVAFSPDGDLIASGSGDGTIKLWDVHNVLTGDTYLRTLRSERPYERMNITGVKGLSAAQKTTLKALGAIEQQ